MGSFSEGLKRDIESALQWINDECTKTAMDAMTFVVDFSPTKFIGAKYAEGVFVNSWYPAINEFDETIGASADMSGSGSRARIAALKDSQAFYRKDGFVSFLNNLDYSMKVEYEGWINTGAYAPVRNAIISIQAANKI